jgi:hypothetical protein
MLAHLSYELMARDTIRERLAQADQDRLAAQLRRGTASSSSWFPRHARASLASALRAFACRLDPSFAAEPCEVRLAVARSR